jgi:hypothetical protein
MSDALAVQIDERPGEIGGRGRYSRADYSLTYRPIESGPEVSAKLAARGGWRQSGARVFVTAGFVTMTFDGMPLVFTELAAYANDARWAERQIATPVAKASASLVLADERLDDDRVSLTIEPSFEVDRTQKMVRIAFAEKSGDWFKIGNDLFAEVGDGILISLVLTSVVFI